MELAMDMRNEIGKLAHLEENSLPFLSLYLNTKWDDEQQRERIRLFTKNQFKRAFEQFKGREVWTNALIKDQQQIEKYVEGLVRHVYNEEMNGIAIFCRSGSGTFLTYPSIISFENECFISDLPVLPPRSTLFSVSEHPCRHGGYRLGQIIRGVLGGADGRILHRELRPGAP